MIHINKFNEKKDEVKEQEVLFNVEDLLDKDQKPSFKTEVEDQEEVKKEFDKLMKIQKFENFTVEVEVEVKPEESEDCEDCEVVEEPQSVGCGCCQDCTGQNDCQCCQDCTCGVETEQPSNDVKVMNLTDFINSLGQ